MSSIQMPVERLNALLQGQKHVGASIDFDVLKDLGFFIVRGALPLDVCARYKREYDLYKVSKEFDLKPLHWNVHDIQADGFRPDLLQMLIDVKPGIVLISFTRIRPVPFSRKKSTRARPEQSMARNVRSARTRIASADKIGTDFPLAFANCSRKCLASNGMSLGLRRSGGSVIGITSRR